ncbi:hypothetical protein ACN24M_39460 [Streptomyces microflavus]|uniref:hypothetical protein n=1 Tax=Streptomyces microflavus TaxID=1919 RepID=UPI003B21993E
MTDVMVEPRVVAADLVRTTALDEAAYRAGGGQDAPSANWDLYDRLTAALTAWQEDGALRPKGLLLVEWLAVEMAGYSITMLGDGVESWLREFGDGVPGAAARAPGRADRGRHPVDRPRIRGPVGASGRGRGRSPPSDRCAVRGVSPRRTDPAGREVLTLGLWAGSRLTSLMHNDAGRINGYLDARDAAPRT